MWEVFTTCDEYVGISKMLRDLEYNPNIPNMLPYARIIPFTYA